MTKFYGRAENVIDALVASFEDGTVAAPLAKSYLPISPDKPSAGWTRRNRFLALVQGCTDARGYRQWQEAGRHVRKGEHSHAAIVAPKFKSHENEDTGEKERYVAYFIGIPVFDVSQTDGDPLPEDEEINDWLSGLPLVDVAESWGITLAAFDAHGMDRLGFFAPGRGAIALGVENLSTWLHELVHAADRRLGERQYNDPLSETVAELGGAVLAHLIDRADAADTGGCWQYIQYQAAQAEQDPVGLIWTTVNRTIAAVDEILEAAGYDAGQPDEVNK